MRIPSLKSERLVLRALQPEDANAIEAICAKAEISKNLSRVPYPYPHGAAQEWLDRQGKGLAGINLAVTRNNKIIGLIGIKSSTERSIEDFVPSIGYWLDSPFWGKGYMKEAMARLLAWYMPLEPTERIRAAVFNDNPRSLKVLSKLGFSEIGQSQGYSEARGTEIAQINLELTTQRYYEAIQ